MGKLEDILQFVVPTDHWVTAMNGCHQDAGHQSQHQTLYVLHAWFWWPGVATQMQKTISNHEQCIQHEGSWAKTPMWPIIVTAPLELLHIDFTSTETTMELDQAPDMVNLLLPLHEACYGICNPWSNCKNCYYIFVARIYLDLWSTC